MRVRTSKVLVPFALCAIGCFAVVFTGCGRKSEPPQAPSHTPASYMNDPSFTGKLAKERKEHMTLVRDRNAIAAKLQAKVEAMRAQLKTDDMNKVRAELEKDPEWQALYAACTNANAKCEAKRKEALGVVRERLTPQKPISK